MGDNTGKQNKENGSRWPLSKTLTVAASVIPLETAILLLCGYGVSLSVEDFGIPHSTLFDSVTDLLPLSIWGLLHIANGLTGFFSGTAIWKLLLVVAKGLAASFALLVFISELVRFATKKWNPEILGKLSSRCGQILEKVAEDWITGTALRTRIAGAGKMVGFMGMMMMAGQTLMVVVTVFVLAVFFFVPITIAIKAGEKHIADGVLAPHECKPVYYARSRLSPNKKLGLQGALCISVTRDGKPVEQGRVVFATSSAVVLFNPETGVAKRVPLEGAVVEAIAELVKPQASGQSTPANHAVTGGESSTS